MIGLLCHPSGQERPSCRLSGRTSTGGQAQWIKPFLNIMMDGVMGVADYQCRQILGDRYHRLAPVFPPDHVIGLDAVDRIPDATLRSGEAPLRYEARAS